MEGLLVADEPDFSRLPSGQLGWSELVEEISKVDPTAERYFYEVKSDVDLNTNEGRAKVAKFVLGAANRDPVSSASRFEGRALMFLGVEHDATPGIPGFEASELQRYVRKFTGTPGPDWDFERVDVGNSRAVIVISVGPPDATMQPWVCESEGLEKLFNGRIYIRGDGNTREATADEIRAMLERRKTATLPQVELAVEVVGMARRYDYEPEVIDNYIAGRRATLMDALPKPPMQKPKASTKPRGELAAAALGYNPTGNISEILAAVAASNRTLFDTVNSFGGGMMPEDRTQDQYIAEIDAWELEVREELYKLLDKAAGCAWPGVRVRITNTTDTYLDEPEVHIHIEGPVEGLDWGRRDDLPVLSQELPSPPRIWGPRPQISSFLGGYGHFDQITMPRFPGVAPQRHRVVRFRNGGSVDLRFSLENLRPRGTWTSDYDDFVLVTRQENIPKLEGKWMATIRGRDAVYEGTVTVEVSPQVSDFSKWLDSELNSEANAD